MVKGGSRTWLRGGVWWFGRPPWAPYWAPYPPNPRVPGQVLAWVNLPPDLRFCPWPGMPAQGEICMTRMRSGVRFPLRPPSLPGLMPSGRGLRGGVRSKFDPTFVRVGEGQAAVLGAERGPDGGRFERSGKEAA